ncbi:MAG: hypothetical protein DI626_07775 [Micavibrio aeruginosavorus]|uniref:Chalcone isomerase domain-containing protein n=1 Tax=Micavibrio aeruginosavorus TaxID=349221 RepID=A0A2W4ZRM4_9BACT|nr:MAG: hypothetical protein DI626_07775 [Micavibrio aeruginosavorus]
MHNIVRAACIYAFLGITPVYAADYIAGYVPEAKLVGQGRAKFLMWDVYDAKLYAPGGVYNENKPFALELKYLQDIKRQKIADHSVNEMRRLGYKNEAKLADWKHKMNQIFPDVTSGSVITGVYSPQNATVFYKNETRAGVIEDPEFGEQFFRIWLDTRTSTPALRKNLLNIDHDMKGQRNEMPSNTRNFGGRHAS